MQVPDGVRIVHRDAHLLVLVKPSGLSTTSPDGGPCLVVAAQELDPGASRLHPSSRLDAEVTGLVIFARTKRATRALLSARQEGRYERTYVALASGVPAPAQGSWDAFVGLDPADPRRRRVVPHLEKGAREALTHYRVGSHLEGASVLWLRPATGRTHQLRVHASHAGVPLLGDVHYGGPRRVVRSDGRVVTARRVMLHCTALSVPNVEKRGTSLTLSEPPPVDFVRSWTELGGKVEDLTRTPPGI